MEVAYITYHDKDSDKIKKDTITANTPRRIHELIGNYLSKQFMGKIVVREYLYVRGA